LKAFIDICREINIVIVLNINFQIDVMTTVPFYQEDPSILEMGIDEAGRGPLFGRVYTAAVILPKEGFDYTRMKDSKRFHSNKKILEEETYVKENALAWSVCYCDEKRIDSINILQATVESMHKCVKKITTDMGFNNEYFLLVDGNYFTDYIYADNDEVGIINHVTIKGGDDKYSSISAASILAKCARDRYIDELCETYPELNTRYGIRSNKGYGAKVHMDGIQEYGITQFHRLSYRPCKNVDLNTV